MKAGTQNILVGKMESTHHFDVVVNHSAANEIWPDHKADFSDSPPSFHSLVILVTELGKGVLAQYQIKADVGEDVSIPIPAEIFK